MTVCKQEIFTFVSERKLDTEKKSEREMEEEQEREWEREGEEELERDGGRVR